MEMVFGCRFWNYKHHWWHMGIVDNTIVDNMAPILAQDLAILFIDPKGTLVLLLANGGLVGRLMSKPSCPPLPPPLGGPSIE